MEEESPIIPTEEISVDYIQNIVSRITKIPIEDINLPDRIRGTRKQEKIIARQLSMYFIKKYIGLSLAKIGFLHGGRDHVTALYAIKTINNGLGTNEKRIVIPFTKIDLEIKNYGKYVTRTFKVFMFADSFVNEHLLYHGLYFTNSPMLHSKTLTIENYIRSVKLDAEINNISLVDFEYNIKKCNLVEIELKIV
jgi:hypothetical protein